MNTYLRSIDCVIASFAVHSKHIRLIGYLVVLYRVIVSLLLLLLLHMMLMLVHVLLAIPCLRLLQHKLVLLLLHLVGMQLLLQLLLLLQMLHLLLVQVLLLLHGSALHHRMVGMSVARNSLLMRLHIPYISAILVLPLHILVLHVVRHAHVV
jgi:hypothetical protein